MTTKPPLLITITGDITEARSIQNALLNLWGDQAQAISVEFQWVNTYSVTLALTPDRQEDDDDPPVPEHWRAYRRNNPDREEADQKTP